MIFPFVNWFWKREKAPSIDWKWSESQQEALDTFYRKSRELDERMAHFEMNLTENQYQDYMAMRKVAQEVNFAWGRVETLGDLMSMKNKLPPFIS